MGSKDIECRCSQKYGQCRLGMTASSYSRKPHFVFENRERSFAARSLSEELLDGIVVLKLKTLGFQSQPLLGPVELGFTLGDFHRAIMAVRTRPTPFSGKI